MAFCTSSRIGSPISPVSSRAPSRITPVLLVLALLCAAVRASPESQPTSTPVLEGVVVDVVDGDTVDVRLSSGRIRVRLHAIDTPEREQPHYRAAREALAALVLGQTVQLEPYEQDRYDRVIARVWLGPLDVNAEMIRQGHAWAYRRYADDPQYCRYEKSARDLARGLWRLPDAQRIAPWEWRRRAALDGHFRDYSNETVDECVATLGK